MLNYEVDAALLAPLVPRGTELDRWKDRALVSLVGFRFVNARVLGVPWLGYRDFEEVNLRFYVKRASASGDRRGVVFIREIVPRHTIAWVARLAYNEPYRARRMQHAITIADSRTGLRYEWRERGRWVGMQAWTSGASSSAPSGSETEFITEHYWGYTRRRDGGTTEYRVDHPRWKTWQAIDGGVTGDMAATYGEGFARALAGRPRSAFVADGSAVTVYQASRLPHE